MRDVDCVGGKCLVREVEEGREGGVREAEEGRGGGESEREGRRGRGREGF